MQSLRLPSPLIKPDVRISRIRLSDRLHSKLTVVGEIDVRIHTADATRIASLTALASAAEPSESVGAQREQPIPQASEPRQREKLWADNPEQSFDQKQTSRVGANDNGGAGDPMPFARNRYSAQLQGLDDAGRDEKQHQGLARPQSLDVST